MMESRKYRKLQDSVICVLGTAITAYKNYFRCQIFINIFIKVTMKSIINLKNKGKCNSLKRKKKVLDKALVKC